MPWLPGIACAVGCGGSDGPDTAEPPVRCTALGAGDHNLTLDHDGQVRSYVVHVPPLYAGAQVPLVIDLHGLTSNANQQEGISGWRAKADQQGFLAVYPNGLDASWNGGSLCCGTSRANGVDDEGFIRAIVGRMQEEGCLDPARVYATGLSNGGAMSHLLACRAADVFAATAPVSMGNGTVPCTPSRPISVVMFRGTSDVLVPYDGGVIPSAQADFDQWSTLDGCSGEPTTIYGACETHASCNAGVEVTLCTLDAGHVLYDGAAQQGAAVADVAWEAFARHSLP
jgi:polyhydroxybutyrate depolymerase